MDIRLDNCIRKYGDSVSLMVDELAKLLLGQRVNIQNYDIYNSIFECILTHETEIIKLYKTTQTSEKNKIQQEIGELKLKIKKIQSDMEYSQSRLAALEGNL